MRHVTIATILLLALGVAAHADWTVRKKVDKFTDETSLQVLQKGSSDSPRNFALLLVICRSQQQPVVLIDWGEPVVGSPQVRLRFDKGKPWVFAWDFTSDGMAGIMPTSQWMLHDLLHSRHLIARVEPRFGPMMTAEFDLRGLRRILVAHPKLCALPAPP